MVLFPIPIPIPASDQSNQHLMVFGELEKREMLAVAGNWTQGLSQCSAAMATKQPPAHTILYMHCTDAPVPWLYYAVIPRRSKIDFLNEARLYYC